MARQLVLQTGARRMTIGHQLCSVDQSSNRDIGICGMQVSEMRWKLVGQIDTNNRALK